MNLYVANLDETVTENRLRDVFSAYGTITSVKVHNKGDPSRGFSASILFSVKEDAERAMADLNNAELGNRMMSVVEHRASKPPRPEYMQQLSPMIAVRNLGENCNEMSLKEAFSHIGPITFCQIASDRSTGFIRFQRSPDALCAIIKMDNSMFCGRQIAVRWDWSSNLPCDQPSDADRAAQGGGLNLFVKNLDKNCDAEMLFAAFSRIGQVFTCKILRNKEGKSRGSAFVFFPNADDGRRALKEMNSIVIGKCQIELFPDIGNFQPHVDDDPDETPKGMNLYFNNVDEACSVEMLRQAFTTIGPISLFRVMRDEKSCRFGFVHFSNAEDGRRALMAMDGLLLGSKHINVSIDQRKFHLQNEIEKSLKKNTHKFNPLLIGALGDGKFNCTELFLKNLDEKVNKETLEEKLGHFDGFKRCDLKFKVAYVSYSTMASALKAAFALDGEIFEGCSKPLDIAMNFPRMFRDQMKLRQKQLETDCDDEEATDGALYTSSKLGDLDCHCKKNVVEVLLQCGCAVCKRCSDLIKNCAWCGVEISQRVPICL